LAVLLLLLLRRVAATGMLVHVCVCAFMSVLESGLGDPFRNVKKLVRSASRDLTETSGPCRCDFKSRMHPVPGRDVRDWVRSGALNPM
jgi:hypothetical protein